MTSLLPPPLIAVWPLTFLAWPFAFAALAAVIPILLHMIHRQKAKLIPFPTLRFLQISVKKTQRRKRVHDLLLMLMRAAVLVLIALGLARPTLTHLRVLLGSAPSAAVILLDNSASMGTIDQQQSRFELALDAASQILDELGGQDQVAILVTGGPPLPEFGHLDSNQEKIRQVLPQCHVSAQHADLAAKIEEARKLLRTSDATNKQIYVLTDMQSRSWDRLKPAASGDSPAEAYPADPATPPKEAEADPDISVLVVDCAGAPRPNVAVHGVEIKTPVPVAGLPVTIRADLWNTAEQPQQALVDLVIDGTKEQTSPVVAIPPQSHAKCDFTYTFQHGGVHRGEVRLLGDDGSKLDDRRFFTLELDQGIPVAIVKPKRHEIPYLEESFYLERALSAKAGRWAIAATPLVADDLRTEPLDRFKVVFCVDLPAPDAETAERLRAYAAGGGNLFWIVGDHVVPADYNRMNTSARTQLLPSPLADARAAEGLEGRDSWQIGSLDARHPALTSLVDPPTLYRSVLVTRHVPMEVDRTSGAWVLASLDDGQPLLVERKVEQGRVLLLGIDVHGGWSNLPLRTIFRPLMVRMVFELAGVDPKGHDVLAGAPLILPLKSQGPQPGIEVHRPSGNTIRLRGENLQANRDRAFHYADTYEPGVYRLKTLDGGEPSETAFAVNADPDESDPARIDPDDLRARLAPSPMIFAENPADLAATFLRLREGTSLWGFFLWTVLVVLVLETFVSNRLSPKSNGFPPLPDSAMLEPTQIPTSEASS
jgi:hypothetical protein